MFFITWKMINFPQISQISILHGIIFFKMCSRPLHLGQFSRNDTNSYFLPSMFAVIVLTAAAAVMLSIYWENPTTPLSNKKQVQVED